MSTARLIVLQVVTGLLFVVLTAGSQPGGRGVSLPDDGGATNLARADHGTARVLLALDGAGMPVTASAPAWRAWLPSLAGGSAPGDRLGIRLSGSALLAGDCALRRAAAWVGIVELRL